MPDSTQTWDIASAFPATSSPKPAPLRTLSKRRGSQQPRSAGPELEDTAATYPQNDTPFPRKCASDEELRDKRGDRNHILQDGSTPDAFTQRAVRRKKSSFDLRDLFLTGGLPPDHAGALSEA